MRRPLRRLTAVVWFAGLTALSACSSGNNVGTASRHAAPAVPVVIATAVQKNVPVEIRAIGNVEPYSTVSIKSQIAGQVAEVHFQEGDHVRRHDLLFVIDPRSYEAKLHEAKANLARDQASARNATLNEKRLKPLLAQGLVAQSEYDQAYAQAGALAATVNADRAALRDAEVQLQYCYIHAPIDGRIGQILVHRGNVVKDNDTVLAVINQIQPVYVAFSVPEQKLPDIRERAAAQTLPVEAFIPAHETAPVTGKLRFINNTVDTSSGTILLKGLFANTDEVLWPGQFVDVALILGTQHDAVLVPAQAVEAGQEGQYVYVVGADLAAEMRPVVTGVTFGTDTVIEKGLKPGERVVTDGQVRLAPGMKVEIKNAAAAPAAGTPAA